MEPIQQIQKWQSQIDASPNFEAADPDVAKRLLKHGIECLEENAKLREQLAEVSIARHDALYDAVEWQNRAEAAESKLRAASEQEPVVYLNLAVWKQTGYDAIYATPTRAFDNQDALYATPIPPVDVRELQEKLEESKWGITELAAKLNTAIDALEERDDKEARQEKRIAELERKLVEQMADNRRMVNRVCNAMDATKELNTLLAQAREEGRKEAEQDTARLNWIIRNECQVWEVNRRYSVHDVTEHHPITDEYMTARDAIDAAMLAAAPTPGEKE